MTGKVALRLEKEIIDIVQEYDKKEQALRNELLELLYPKIIKYYLLTRKKITRVNMIRRLHLEHRYFTFYRIIKIYNFIDKYPEVKKILKKNKLGYKHIGVIPNYYLLHSPHSVIEALKQGLSTTELQQIFTVDKENVGLYDYNRKILFHKVKYRFATINKMVVKIIRLHKAETKLKKTLRQYNERITFTKYLANRETEIEEELKLLKNESERLKRFGKEVFADYKKPLYIPNGRIPEKKPWKYTK